jgi:hypothetical protein
LFFLNSWEIRRCNATLGRWRRLAQIFKSQGEIAANKETGRFPLKDRDEAQSASVGFLKSKGLSPETEDADDWQVVISRAFFFPQVINDRAFFSFFPSNQ